MTSTVPTTDDLVRAYLQAKRAVVDGGYASEVVWQARAAADPLTPTRFISEAAWVILCTGMRESVIRQQFPLLTAALRRFDPDWLTRYPATARARALMVFAHHRKIDAVLSIAARAHALGTCGLRDAFRDPEPFLRSLPYIGPVTWRHLAKNLGIQVPKADRHLVRLARAAGRSSVDELCGEISGWLGEPIAVVDVVLWRWSVLHAQVCTRPCAGLPHSDLG